MNLMIQQIQAMIAKINKLEYITETYHEYKDEKESFIKYLREKIKRLDKARNDDSTRNNEQQEVPESTGGDKGAAGDTKKKSNNKKKEGTDNESV